MNEIIQEIYRTRKVTDNDGNEYDIFPVSIKQHTGQLIYETIRYNGIKNSLETGLAYGVSTLFACQAIKDNGGQKHIAIDFTEEKIWHNIGIKNIKKANLQNYFIFENGKSCDILPKIQTEIGFAFIDGGHVFDEVLLDFYYIDRLMSVGGYILFHDDWIKSVQKVINFVLKNRYYSLPNSNINTCLIRKEAEDNRNWDNFVEF